MIVVIKIIVIIIVIVVNHHHRHHHHHHHHHHIHHHHHHHHHHDLHWQCQPQKSNIGQTRHVFRIIMYEFHHSCLPCSRQLCPVTYGPRPWPLSVPSSPLRANSNWNSAYLLWEYGNCCYFSENKDLIPDPHMCPRLAPGLMSVQSDKSCLNDVVHVISVALWWTVNAGGMSCAWLPMMMVRMIQWTSGLYYCTRAWFICIN